MGAGQDSGQKTGQVAEARRPRKALAPGSFLQHMLDSRHTASGQPFSDIEITAQAFIFLLAGETSIFLTPCTASSLTHQMSALSCTGAYTTGSHLRGVLSYCTDQQGLCMAASSS